MITSVTIKTDASQTAQTKSAKQNGQQHDNSVHYSQSATVSHLRPRLPAVVSIKVGRMHTCRCQNTDLSRRQGGGKQKLRHQSKHRSVCALYQCCAENRKLYIYERDLCAANGVKPSWSAAMQSHGWCICCQTRNSSTQS